MCFYRVIEIQVYRVYLYGLRVVLKLRTKADAQWQLSRV